MVFDKLIEGKFIHLRAVEENDAEQILKWRTDENISKYLHKVDNNLNKQIEWIRNQRQREGDYYFIIEKKDKTPVGTIGLYNIQKTQGEFGRWISLNPIFSLESAILIYDYAFYTINLDRVISRTVKINNKVVNFHLRFGATLVNDNLTILNDEFIYTECEVLKENYKSIREKNINLLKGFGL